MTSTKTQEVTTAQRIAILKHLASGKDLDTVAAIMRGIDRDTIGDIARHHGYPDPDKLNWAVDILTKKQEEAEKASIPTSAHVPQPAARPATTSPSSVTSPDARPVQGPDEIRVLLNTAKAHPSKRIQAAADRVFDNLDKLRTLIRDDQEKHAERRKAEAEKAAARAEVERLERQLAEAKAKLRGKTASPQSPGGRTASESGQLASVRGGGLVTTADLDALGTTSKEVRTWAHDNDVECPDTGRLPSRVLDAWKTAHPEAGAA